MADRSHTFPIAGKSTVLSSALWLAVSVVICLSVLIANGKPLFYWDTIGYIEQGQNALHRFGFPPPAPRAASLPQDTAAPADATAPAADPAAPKTVDGSRSLSYSILSGALANLRLLDMLVLLHMAAVLLAVAVPLRVAARMHPTDMPVPKLMTLTLLAAGVGSMPFFVAYLMPDIFAPVMVLTIATLSVFRQQLSRGEFLMTLALGALAVVAHLSHLGVASLLVPLALIVGLSVSRKGWITLVLALAVMVGAGFAQQKVIRLAARSVVKSEVVIKPFLTARLIQDGPGWTYLKAVCPTGAAVPECPLYDRLAVPDDPWRRTASHIIFQTTQELGSFRLLSPQDQVQIARAQVGFFLRVLKAHPFATTFALLKNTAIQSSMIAIDMTIPTQNIIDQHQGVAGLMSGTFGHGRITQSTGWIAPVTFAQGIWYLLTGLVLVWLVVATRTPKELKAFAIILVLGILVNAFVCGGISQPATRYGARIIWLVPFAATFLFLFRHANGTPRRTAR